MASVIVRGRVSTSVALLGLVKSIYYLLVVSLNQSLKRNKLESQCRYHKCIIEQKQTKVTNLLVNSDIKTKKQKSVMTQSIIKHSYTYALPELSQCISAGKANYKQRWERVPETALQWNLNYDWLRGYYGWILAKKGEFFLFVLNISLIYLHIFILFKISFVPPEKQSFQRLGNVSLFVCYGNGNECLV